MNYPIRYHFKEEVTNEQIHFLAAKYVWRPGMSPRHVLTNIVERTMTIFWSKMDDADEYLFIHELFYKIEILSK